MLLRHRLGGSVSIVATLIAVNAWSQTTSNIAAPESLRTPAENKATAAKPKAPTEKGVVAAPAVGAAETVVVRAQRPVSHLNEVNSTGSKLGLSVKETPATVNIVDALTLRQQGYQTVQEAVQRAPGITVGGSPADPSSFSMRGFTGDQINLLRDGVYYGPSDIVNRPENSFNLKDIEVLQGPASVLYGQGAVGGVINVITRQPTFTPTKWDGLFTYGSFNTIQAGIAVNSQVSDNVAVNLAFSRTSSSGYVDNDNPDSLNVTGSVLWNIRSNLHLQAGIDIVTDHLSSYYGTPLIPSADVTDPQGGILKSSKGLVVNKPTEYTNYNTIDSVHKNTSYSPSLLLTWEVNNHITFTNQAYLYDAERRWQNAENYTYIPPGSTATDAAGQVIPGNSIARDRFYVYHQQHLYGNQAHVIFDQPIFGLKNRVTFGIDASYLQFLRSRGFPDAQYADYVSLTNPVQGTFGSFPGEFPQEQSPTQITDVAGLFEDVLDLTPHLHFVSGLRDEWLRLQRENYNQAGVESSTTGFNKNFNPTNFRVGLVYDIVPDVTAYASYTTAQDPPGGNIFLANRGQFNKLTSSSQEEIGLKSEFLDRRATATLALYNIDRSNILIATSDNTVGTVGSQNSRGAEFEADFRLLKNWTISANATYTHASYGAFTDPYSGLSDAGNRPPDVPTWTAAIFSTYSHVAKLPLDIGGDVRYVGNRAGSFDNTLLLSDYELVDIYAVYHVTRTLDVTGRINNLLGKTYVSWADTNYPTEVDLGRPRYFEVDLHAGF